MYVQTLSRVLGSLVLFLQTTLHANPADSKRRLESQALHRAGAASGCPGVFPRKACVDRTGPTAAKLRCESVVKTVCPALRNCQLWRASLKTSNGSYGSAVQFLFVADPMDQTSAQEVIDFGRVHGRIPLADGCPGRAMPHNGLRSCLIDVPNVDPARSSSDAAKLSLGSSDEVRPMTLFADKQGCGAKAFVGSMGSHPAELVDAIELTPVGAERQSHAEPTVTSQSSCLGFGIRSFR